MYQFDMVRKNFLKEEKVIEFDQMRAQDFSYELFEVETCVSSIEAVDKAWKELCQWVKGQNFSSFKSSRGKLLEYLYKKQPKHYQKIL